LIKKLKLLIILFLFCIFFASFQNKSYAYISVNSGDMAQAIVDAITDNASIFQQNNQSNASNSLSYYEQAIENIDKIELATAINKFLDKIQTASGDISFNDISMYVFIQNSSYTSYPLQLEIMYSTFDSNSDVTRYTVYASNDGTGFSLSPYDTSKGILYQDIQITPQGKVYGLSWSSFTPLIRKTSTSKYRFPAIENVNIEERTGGLYYKPLISFGTSQFVTLNNGADIYGLNLNRLNFSDSGGITPTPSGDTPSGDTPSGDTPSGDTPSGDTPSGDTPSGDTPSGEQSGDNTQTAILNTVDDINNNLTTPVDLSGETVTSGDITSALGFNLVSNPYENFWTSLISGLNTALTTSVRSRTITFRDNSYTINLDDYTLQEPTALKTFLATISSVFVLLVLFKWIKQTVDEITSGDIDSIIKNNQEERNY